MKRTTDLLFATLSLLALFPLFIVLIGLVYWRLGAPVFFCQIRPGLKGRPFPLLKFRSMLETRDSNGELLPDSDRLVWLGKFLRRTSMDELPQLLNVLKGEMSLVGPRPLLLEYLPLYSHEQARRHDVRPGLTGWAQINGRNAISWEQKLALDVWYVDNRSFLLDAKIIILTFGRIFGGTNVTPVSGEIMPKFTGSSTICSSKLPNDQRSEKY